MTRSPTPTRLPAHRPSRHHRPLLSVVAVCGFLVILAPVVLLAGAGNPPCEPANSAAIDAPSHSASGGTYASPLRLQPGRWYRVGATKYGGPADPTSGDYGASGAYLPSYPDSFAELSLLDTNPAKHGSALTFQDANALNNLPYGTGLRIANGAEQTVLYKRDIGYGQGPGQAIPYRLDIWWEAAEPLGVTKTLVDIQLAPPTGTGATLGQLPSPAAPSTGAGCATPAGPLPLTLGQTATIDPTTGVAAAPADAPAVVKRAIAAGDQLIAKPYIYGGGHGQPLTELATGYDCSATTSYILHAAGLLGDYAEDSTQLESYGQPGPGQWITVYANSAHAFIDIAGAVMDTAWYAPVQPADPASGPRWQPESIIGAQYASDQAAGNGGFVQRHPNGL